ncbi:DNA-binding XRE family transcriptional regulator [Pullulanibacillus pueri]|uniref:XRE family transcriptional regulator n=1 Tax=Pullulanibacillus pueri TaxID=1437324 RepID=A0A8J2ZZW7_9BACL|nr:helix-turn-helix domain-containing protein [Pullulanibacillus pueri]MBM7683779.1 DNA-binding XRE family transcriptional regulator [Pullulanibacillus pueri]GGH87272.1 XRE family transcriptional regulator [Pullulanibacillus pueri]
MSKEHIMESVSSRFKVIRLEKGYSQDKMAKVLGISKKTLVQIEKGRILSGWTTIVAICALFRDSEVLQVLLGGDPMEVIETIAHDGVERPRSKSLGGRVWWKEIDKKGSFRLQQNMISQHYRILDESNNRWLSTFEKEDALRRLEELFYGESLSNE